MQYTFQYFNTSRQLCELQSCNMVHYIITSCNKPKSDIMSLYFVCVCVCVGSRRWGLQGDSTDGAGVLLAEHEGGGHAARTAVSEPASALHRWRLAHAPRTHHQRTGQIPMHWNLCVPKQCLTSYSSVNYKRSRVRVKIWVLCGTSWLGGEWDEGRYWLMD